MGYSTTASDLADELAVLSIERGSPRELRMDNGPEFISKALRGWVREVVLVFIRTGQPGRNGFIEFLKSRLRDECFSVNQFHSLSHAKGVIGIWKKEYNQTRPHSSLGSLAPAFYRQQCTHYKPATTLTDTGPKPGAGQQGQPSGLPAIARRQAKSAPFPRFIIDRRPNVTELERDSSRGAIIAAPVNFDEEASPRGLPSDGPLPT